VIEILGTLAAALGVGALSAWVPLVNAEAYVLALAATTSPVHGWSSVAGIAIGQTAGKQLMFAAARGGSRSGWLNSARWRGRFARPGRRRPAEAPVRTPREPGPFRRRMADWGERGLQLLDRPWPASGVVLAAASVGIPPLAVVSVAAGLRGTSGLLVAVCTLAGRAARFAAMAAPVIALRS
jgi:membrane protein YqaA with SNARE-associated domain